MEVVLVMTKSKIMETKINNSVVANNNSTISNSTIKSTDEEIKQDYNIKNSVVAQNGSQNNKCKH